jgi:hypothetical protein
MVNGRLLRRAARPAGNAARTAGNEPATMRALRNWPVRGELLQILVECRWFEFYENTRRICFETGQKARHPANRRFKPRC